MKNGSPGSRNAISSPLLRQEIRAPGRVDTGTRNDGLTEPASDRVDRVRSNGPAERTSRDRRGDPSPEWAPTGGLDIGDRDELEVRVTERHDPVRRTPRRMTPTLHRSQPVPRLEPGRLEREVADRQDHMVDRQHGEPSVRPCAARPAARARSPPASEARRWLRVRADGRASRATRARPAPSA